MQPELVEPIVDLAQPLPNDILELGRTQRVQCGVVDARTPRLRPREHPMGLGGEPGEGLARPA